MLSQRTLAAAVVAALSLSLSAFGQTWTVDVPWSGGAQGAGRVNGVLALPDGGVVVSGVRGSTAEGFVARWDAIGQLVFEVIAAGGDPGRPWLTPDGQLLVPWSGASAVGRIDLAGGVQWSLPSSDGMFSVNGLRAVVPGAAGQAVAVGERSGCFGSCSGGIEHSGAAARFSLAGSWLGQTTVFQPGSQGIPGGAGNQTALSGAGLGDGRVAICGRSPVQFSTDRGWVVGLDGSGAVQWQLGVPTGGFGSSSACTAVCVSAPGTYAVVGYRATQGFVSWLSATGQVLQEVAIGTTQGPYPVAVAAAGDGGILVAAREIVAPDRRIVLLRFDPAGQLLWQRRFAALEGSNVQLLADLARSANGGWFLGTARTVAPSQTVPRVYRLDAEGRVQGGCPDQLADPSYTVQPAAQLVGVTLSVFSAGAFYTSGNTTLAPGATQGQFACFHPAPEVTPQGGQLGGSLSFATTFPAHAGEFALVVLSTSTPTAVVALPGGVSALLQPDILTTVGLQHPALAPVLLDGAGAGVTGAIAIPGDPALSGLGVISVAASFSLSAGVFTATTQPSSIVLQ
jgi:hypothetical protein